MPLKAHRFAGQGDLAVNLVPVLLVCGRELADRLSGVGGSVTFRRLDVSEPGDWAELRAWLEQGQAELHGLVNNAGIAHRARIDDVTLEGWNRTLAINLTGPFHCCRALAPQMIAQNYGRIVNVASIAGKEGNPNASAYSASKAGLIALTKSLGKELAEHDISVNCVTPAAAKTALFSQMKQEHIDYMLSKIPRGRFVTVDEIAATVAFCASQDCSFTTGAVFDISGGRATY